jgi:hypothetical protein
MVGCVREWNCCVVSADIEERLFRKLSYDIVVYESSELAGKVEKMGLGHLVVDFGWYLAGKVARSGDVSETIALGITQSVNITCGPSPLSQVHTSSSCRRPSFHQQQPEGLGLANNFPHRRHPR